MLYPATPRFTPRQAHRLRPANGRGMVVPGRRSPRIGRRVPGRRSPGVNRGGAWPPEPPDRPQGAWPAEPGSAEVERGAEARGPAAGVGGRNREDHELLADPG